MWPCGPQTRPSPHTTWPGLPWPSRSHQDLDATVTCGHPMLIESGHFPQGAPQEKCSEPQLLTRSAQPQLGTTLDLQGLAHLPPHCSGKGTLEAGLKPTRDLLRQGQLPARLLPLVGAGLSSARPPAVDASIPPSSIFPLRSPTPRPVVLSPSPFLGAD